jgi:hypothetical protein
LIQQAEGFFDFYLKHLGASNDTRTDKGRLAVVKAMGEALRKTGSAVLLDTHAQKTAQRLGVAVEAVRAEFRKAPKTRPPVEPSAAADSDSDDAPTAAPPSEREFWLMRYLLQAEDLGWLAGQLDVTWIQHPLVRQIIARRLAAQAEHRWHNVTGLLAECPDEPSQRLITQAMARDLAAVDLQQSIASTVQLLRNDYLDQELDRLTQRLAQPDLPEADLIEIENQKAHVRQLKRQPITGDATAP